MSTTQLKILGIFTMLIDHIGAIAFPQYSILRIIGRIAFPIFAFQCVVSFRKTSNQSKYIKNLFIFALLSQLPYSLALGSSKLNIFFTLGFGLFMLFNYKGAWYKKYLVVSVTCLLSMLLSMDYGIYGILTIYLFHVSYGEKLKTVLYQFGLLVLFIGYMPLQLFSLLALIPIMYFNGEFGSKGYKKFKYIFYGFYPAHLFVLYLFTRFK